MTNDVYESVVSFAAFAIPAFGLTIWKRRKHRRSSAQKQRLFDVRTAATTTAADSISTSSRLVQHLLSFTGWTDYNADEESFIRDFPKIELHVVSTTTICPDSDALVTHGTKH